jgi:phenylpropionate dioxygenase-like ring-hydroxylating dioxygenase large terminal subunit
MAILDHWHPVLATRELRHRPVAVKLCGRNLALFRTKSGAVGALEDLCPHRRSKLSTGTVVGERLRCQYHAWTFDCGGNGESPGSPKLSACAASYDVREAHEYIWVKPRGAAAEFPELDFDGFTRIGEMRHRFPAPFELVLDNFVDMEHTTINHNTFGHGLDGIAAVTVQCESDDRTATVRTAGPTKDISFIKKVFLGAWPSYHFHADDVIHFSPVYVKYDHYWKRPTDGREGMVRWRLYLFFVPAGDSETDVVSFMYAKSRWPGASLGWKVVGPLYLWETDREIRRDLGLLANLADKDVGLDGMKLSRFDKILGLTRERIGRIYRGGSPATNVAGH